MNKILKIVTIAANLCALILIIILIKERHEFKPQHTRFIEFDRFQEKNGIEYVRIMHKDGLAIYMDSRDNAVMVIATKKWGIDNLNELK